MNSDQLSIRLQTVADFVEKYGNNPIRLADIGTDHAYLPVYLSKRGLLTACLAGEVVQGPYLSAVKEIEDQGLENQIDVRLGSGLEIIKSEDQINLVTICGMGGPLICQILSGPRQKLQTDHRLILQANTGGPGLRTWLNQHGYQIVDESFVYENQHAYEIIVAQAKGPHYQQNLSQADLLLGPFNRQSGQEDYKNYWLKQVDKYKEILTEMRKSKFVNYGKIRSLQENIKIIGKEFTMSDKREIIFQDLINYLDSKYPADLAEDWDKVGLHFGYRQGPVHKVMTALDIRPNLVAEAIEKDVDTIIVHHPPIFTPIKRFDLSQPMMKAFADLIKHDIKVFAIHTNLDIAWDGMNDWLCQALELDNIQSFKGQGLDHEPSLGRVGLLKNPMSRQEVLKHFKESFNLDKLTVIEGQAKETYQKIAVIGGSGSSLLDQVKEEGADIFLTGDITYHIGQEAEDLGFMTIDVGHYVEHIFVEKMAGILDLASHEFNWDIEVIPSQSRTSPFVIE